MNINYETEIEKIINEVSVMKEIHPLLYKHKFMNTESLYAPSESDKVTLEYIPNIIIGNTIAFKLTDKRVNLLNIVNNQSISYGFISTDTLNNGDTKITALNKIVNLMNDKKVVTTNEVDEDFIILNKFLDKYATLWTKKQSVEEIYKILKNYTILLNSNNSKDKVLCTNFEKFIDTINEIFIFSDCDNSDPFIIKKISVVDGFINEMLSTNPTPKEYINLIISNSYATFSIFFNNITELIMSVAISLDINNERVGDILINKNSTDRIENLFAKIAAHKVKLAFENIAENLDIISTYSEKYLSVHGDLECKTKAITPLSELNNTEINIQCNKETKNTRNKVKVVVKMGDIVI